MNSLEDLLRENRPTLTAMELDQVKQRARAQARKTDIYGWKGIRIMRPRLVATSLLVAGMFFTGSGATLAVISDSGSAGVVQYPETSVPTPTPEQTVAPTQEQGGNAPATQEQQPAEAPAGQEVLGEPLDRVEGRVYRALRKLRNELGASVP